MAITTKTDEHISLKLLVKEESNKVLFAEAGKDFVDILCSFLTLPLGTIARLVEKDSDIGPVTVGCLNSLYHSAEDLDKEYLLTETSKEMLLQPKNSSEQYCSTLKLNIDDTKPTNYFVCNRYGSGCSYSYLSMGSRATQSCVCSRYPASRSVFLKHISNGFVNDVATFVITDDLTVIPNSMDYTSYSMLLNFGIKDTSSVKEITVNLTKEKVLDLLKCFLLSKSPLTDLFLREKPTLKRSMFLPADILVEDSSNIQIILKLVIRKSNGKILYAQGEQDFADILLSFLTFPLGGVVQKLGGNCSLGSIDGLYKSIAELDGNKYFTSQEAKNMLIDPYLHPQYQLNKHISPIFEPCILKYYCYCQPNSYNDVYVQFFKADENRKVEGNLREMQLISPKSLEGTSDGYVKGPIVYVATDDLAIAPLSPISACNLINHLKIPLTDLKEKVVTIGLKECLNILMASLTSSSALTDGLGHLITDVIEKQVTKKQGTKTRSRSRRDT